MRLSAEVIGTAPVERVDVLHGNEVVHSVRPFGAADLGRRVRVLWQGAEYRGRGRETHLAGQADGRGQPHRAVCAGEFPQPRAEVPRPRPVRRSPGPRSRPAISPASISGSTRRDAARSRSRPMSCRARSTLQRSPTMPWPSTAAGLAASSASIACPRPTGAGASRFEHTVTLRRRRRPAGLYPRHAGRRPPGLDQPDLSDRVSGNAAARL